MKINNCMREIDTHPTITSAYHGSPKEFDQFDTAEVFLAKDPKESLRYGKVLYQIWFKGPPKFETDTIYVIDNTQIVKIKRIQ